jgi:hypothetical protein
LIESEKAKRRARLIPTFRSKKTRETEKDQGERDQTDFFGFQKGDNGSNRKKNSYLLRSQERRQKKGEKREREGSEREKEAREKDNGERRKRERKTTERDGRARLSWNFLAEQPQEELASMAQLRERREREGSKRDKRKREIKTKERDGRARLSRTFQAENYRESNRKKNSHLWRS